MAEHTSDNGTITVSTDDMREEPEFRAQVAALRRPAHYTQTAIEPLDVIEAWGLNFARGCVVKYIARAPYKGDELGDLMKARVYLDREIARLRRVKGGDA